MFLNKVKKKKLTSAGVEVRGFLCRGATPQWVIKTLNEIYLNKQQLCYDKSHQMVLGHAGLQVVFVF